LGKPISTAMKRILLLFISTLFFPAIFSAAQDEITQIRPLNGKEYLYEISNSQYLFGTDGKKMRPLISTKKLHIKFSKTGMENLELLQVKTIKNTIKKPEQEPPQYLDYRYPKFRDGFYGRRYDNYYEEFLCDVEFQYEYNVETSEIELYNRPDILLEVREKLNRKGFNKKEIDRYTTEFNEKAIPQMKERIQSVFNVPQQKYLKVIDADKDFHPELSVKDSVSTFSASRAELRYGLNSLKISADIKEHCLKYFNKIEIDTLKRRAWNGKDYSNKTGKETDIRLISYKNIQPNTLTISGNIEHLRYKKITLYTLRRPFGNTLHQESVFLDENNAFHIETELNHPELVFLKFGQDNRNEKPSIISLYAVPGSNIQLNATGETFPWKVGFSGDNNEAATMLYDFFNTYNLNPSISDNNFNWWIYRIPYADYEKASKNLESFLAKYQNQLQKPAYDFISNELKALIEGGTLYYLSLIHHDYSFGYAMMIDPRQKEIDINWLEENVGKYPLLEVYNDYGIYSRELAGSCWQFQLQSINKINDNVRPSYETGIVVSGYRSYGDLPFQTEVAKSVLTGHALYSQLADTYMHHKTRLLENTTQNGIYEKNKIDEYIDLMLRLCNNYEFSEALYQFNQNHINWEDSTYVPSNEFFNAKAEPVLLKDFFGEKTTIFYVSQNWGRERYHFDDLAKQNPDFNYVMVNEGNNIQEWIDYIKRAEPVANQLFLVNTELQLQDIFKNSFGHFIIYNKEGKRISYARNPLDATNLAKQFSKETRETEINKSQLQLIILVLTITLLTFIVGFILWKWRIRQRLRKEEQFRKLRELELTAIRSQMNPHFLFNSLNSVQNLVQKNMGREAHLYLSDFAGLIRKVLRNSEKEEVSLAEELEMTEQYLNLEKLRFDFEYHIKVKNGIDQHNTMVPSMLLQPFVENSVIHGLQNKSGEKRINVEVVRSEPGLTISIEDNGIGREAAKQIAKDKNGKGTNLVKERLEVLQQKQGEKYQLEIIDLHGEKTGTRVEILIPEEI